MLLNNVFKYLCIYIIIKGDLIVNSSNFFEEDENLGNRQAPLLDDDEEFPTTEEYGWNGHKDSILSEFDWLNHSKPSSSEEEWRSYDESQKSPFKLMKSEYVDIITESTDGTRLVKNDFTQYQLSSDGFAFFYIFNDDANCVIISYADKLIWDRNVEDIKYSHPKILCFHSDLKMIFIEFEDVLRMYTLKGDLIILLSEKNLEGFKFSNLQVMVRDTTDLSKTIPISKNQYAENCHGFEYEYEFNKDVECTEVKYNNETIWKQENMHESRPKSVFFNMYTKMIIIDFPKHYTIYQFKGNKWKFITNNSLETYSKDDLKFFSNNKEIDDFNYDLIDYTDGKTYVYIFNDVECTDVKFKHESLMRSKIFNVETVYVNLYEKMLMITGQRNMLVYMYIDGWRKIFSYPEDKEIEDLEKLDIREMKLREAREHLATRIRSSRIRPSNKKTIIVTVGVGVSLVLIFILLFFVIK